MKKNNIYCLVIPHKTRILSLTVINIIFATSCNNKDIDVSTTKSEINGRPTKIITGYLKSPTQYKQSDSIMNNNYINPIRMNSLRQYHCRYIYH